MKTVLIAALTAALVAIAILSFWPTPIAPPDPTPTLKALQEQITALAAKVRARPVNVVVVLTQAGPQCRTQTLPRALAYREQTVRWFIVNVNCNLNGREIQLRFASENTPLDAKLPTHLTFIQTKVRSDAPLGSYKYALWAIGKAGDYQLEDPELDIAEFL